jgi:hypothetical protein
VVGINQGPLDPNPRHGSHPPEAVSDAQIQPHACGSTVLVFLPPDEPQAAKQERHDGEFTGVRPMQPECAIPHGKTLYTMLSI